MGAGSKARGWIVYMGWETFNRLQTWLVSPRETSVPELSVIGSSFPIHDILDDYEDSVPVVAPASGWLCPRERDRDGWLVVSDLPQLASESDCTETRRCETLPTSCAVLFRTNLRGLHTRMRLEFDRIGMANANVHRMALTQLTHAILLYHKLLVCATRNPVLSEKFHLTKPLQPKLRPSCCYRKP